MISLCFELLQIAIGNRERLSRTPTEVEWPGINSWMQKQALTGVAFLGIEHLPKEQKPPRRLLLEWYVQTEHIKKHNAKVETESGTAISIDDLCISTSFPSYALLTTTVGSRS